MDQVAVDQAQARLQKARKALDDLKNATNYEEAETAWTDFLLAANTIYSKLEEGAKSHGKSQAWHAATKKSGATILSCGICTMREIRTSMALNASCLGVVTPQDLAIAP